MDTARSVCLTLSRLALAGWTLAAVLFVVTTVQEVSSPEIEAATKAHLTDMRFPAYYSFGFSLLTTGFVTAIFGCQLPGIARIRKVAVISLSGAGLLLMGVDYFWIFDPLREMSADPLAARPAEFVTYHQYSMYLNGLGILVIALAATTLSWPVGSRPDAQTQSQ